jgi:methyltransferase-like protein
MVRITTAGITDPVEIRNRAVSLLATIYRSQSERDPYREAIHAEMERIVAKDAALCFHDDFGEHNIPVYFSEFVRRAAAEGLQFLSEAEPSSTSDFPPDVVESLSQIADVVEREQHYDFLSLRGFRRTLLCRNDLVIDREIRTERLRSLFYASPIKATPSPPDLATFAPTEFVSQGGASITVNQPFVKAVLHELQQAWPGTLTFEHLVERARITTPLLSAEDAGEMVREVLIRMYFPGLLEFSVVPYQYPSSPSEKPVSSRFARMQFRASPRVTSLRQRPVDIDSDLGKAIFPLLDGTHDRPALRECVSRSTGADASDQDIEGALDRLCELSLLEA